MYIWTQWKHLLRFDPTQLTRQKFESFARAFQAKGSPLDCIAGLIDGTLQKNAWPVQNQRLVYNGWKHIHCLKYHAVISPDGLVIHVYGPVDGRHHDETVFKESGLSELLEKHFWTPQGQALYLYGDPGYSVGPHLISPYKDPGLTAEKQAFNTAMSRIREPIEWVFKEVAQQFTFIDFSRSQKILLSPCGLYYLVSLLMCNAHTILHYPQIPQYFTGGPIKDSDLDSWCLDSVWEEVEVEADAYIGSEEEEAAEDSNSEDSDTVDQ
ncbi:hypothetical protein M422DRAFT_259899 [Sphaerobolus stellatus SS14]|uniref:DDE Tnp4 domain-containing protein n=1 Tax=Sphaerobolus stellatus (strain SS14) TaxID=990650 RepID=A0A0C9U3T1_SPHS4|nr:hypothetical protein M422DRAFT_259899 [Sphaerobolus stellatus SS14]